MLRAIVIVALAAGVIVEFAVRAAVLLALVCTLVGILALLAEGVDIDNLLTPALLNVLQGQTKRPVRW